MAWPFIWTNLNPLHPRMFCAKFGWNWPSGSGEEDENVKSLRRRQQRQQRRTTDKLWSEKLTWAFGSGELKMWKVYRRMDRQTTDNRWSEKLTWAFSSGELKTCLGCNLWKNKRMKSKWSHQNCIRNKKENKSSYTNDTKKKIAQNRKESV